MNKIEPQRKLTYQIGRNQFNDVLINWQQSLTHLVLTPKEALELAGHLKRVAQIAIAAKNKARSAEKGGATTGKS